MKLSILMVTYNHENFIAQAIESVLMQETDFEYELIICDDYSTDNTRKIVEQFAADNPSRIRFLNREKNLGPAQNFIKGFFECRGQYVAFLEGDDYWTFPTKLQQQINALDSNPNWAICFHTVRVIHEDGSQPPEEYPKNRNKTEYSLEDLLSVNFIQTCSLVVRNGLVCEFPEWYMKAVPGDWPFSILHAQHGKISYLPEVMATYRRHSAGTWTTRDRIDMLVSTVDMLKSLSGCLTGQHKRRLRQTIAEFHLEIATIQSEKRETISALGSTWRSLITHPINRKAFGKGRCSLFIRIAAPWFHRFILRVFKK